jgi:glyoxylase-like metal-dependent hydrolase (beta-lactamase superfamily II)
VRVQADDPSRDWTEPGIYGVTAGVYRVPLSLPDDGLRAVNAYVLEGDGDLAIVDSGQAIPLAREQLAAALGALSATVTDVSRIVVTHYHRDHYTQAVALRREFGQRLALGAQEAHSLAFHRTDGPTAGSYGPQIELLRECGAAELAGRLVSHAPDESGPTSPSLGWDIWEDPDDWMKDGAVVATAGRRLAAIETPGHTRGHVVYLDEPAGQLFTGDHILPHITPSIGFEGVLAPYPLRDYLESLTKIASLPDAQLLPAHGPVRDSVHARVEELLRHHAQRLDDSQAAVRQGHDTPLTAARQLTWTGRMRSLEQLDDMNAMLAVLETKAHLDLLVLRGVLSTCVESGIRHYAGPGRAADPSTHVLTDVPAAATLPRPGTTLPGGRRTGEQPAYTDHTERS